jgi:hypothetical protein
MSKTEQKRPEEQGNPEVPAPRKRSYRAPELRRLGSVADLTLGGGGSGQDKGSRAML